MNTEGNDNDDDEMTPNEWDEWHRQSWKMHNDRYSSSMRIHVIVTCELGHYLLTF